MATGSGDNKKKIKKEAEALMKLMKEVLEKFEKLIDLNEANAVFANMLKAQQAMLKKHSEATDKIIKNIA